MGTPSRYSIVTHWDPIAPERAQAPPPRVERPPPRAGENEPAASARRESISSPSCTRKPSTSCRMEPAIWSPVCRTTSSIRGVIRRRSVDDPFDAWTQDLDRHRAAVVQAARWTTAIERADGMGSNRRSRWMKRASRGHPRPGLKPALERRVGRCPGTNGIRSATSSPNIARRRRDDLSKLDEGAAQVLKTTDGVDRRSRSSARGSIGDAGPRGGTAG